jgi:hypothetical protein
MAINLPLKTQMPVIQWLFDSDPSIRWQVMRDLIGASAEDVAAERARVATEGNAFFEGELEPYING